jgi:hypothetical protein
MAEAATAVETEEPEVQVAEEPAEVTVETGGDERLGGGREDATQARESTDPDSAHRPSRAALRRQAQRRYQQRLQRENEQLRGQVQQLAQGQYEIAQRVMGNEGATIDAQLADVDGKLQQATLIMSKAARSTAPTAEQDFAEAVTIRDQLLEARRNLYTAKQYREQQAQQQMQPQRQAQAQPEPWQRLAQAYAAENSDWFDPKLANEESRIAARISKAMDIEAEYDRNTPAYWTELDRRIHASPKLAHLFDDDDAAPEREDETAEVEEAAPVRRAAPAAPARPANGGPKLTVGGRERPLKRGEVRVPRELKENMIEAGQWDDPKVRARVIARYQETIRQQRQQ